MPNQACARRPRVPYHYSSSSLSSGEPALRLSDHGESSAHSSADDSSQREAVSAASEQRRREQRGRRGISGTPSSRGSEALGRTVQASAALSKPLQGTPERAAAEARRASAATHSGSRAGEHVLLPKDCAQRRAVRRDATRRGGLGVEGRRAVEGRIVRRHPLGSWADGTRRGLLARGGAERSPRAELCAEGVRFC